MNSTLKLLTLTFGALLCTPLAAAPDLNGTFDVGTLTPLQRAEAYGDNLYLTPERAAAMQAGMQAAFDRDASHSDPDRAAPPAGQSTGGYNMFWLDPGSAANSIDGKSRTSILTRPANGRIPPMTEYGAQRLQGLLDSWTIIWRDPDPTTEKDGSSAWWLTDGNPDGPYDHIEQRPLAERCIIGSRSTAGPPMLPNLYNNFKRIVQTPDHVMILTEMNHDARIIRINSEHAANADFWLGDSVGHWEGDTLVVQTRHFKATPALSGADASLQVTERFTRQADGNLLYAFTINNPKIWTEPWGGEYLWQQADGKVYEYACHEGNYAIGNIMRGARELEADAAAR